MQRLMNAAEEFQARKVFLYGLIASVLLSAVLGIVALLAGNWGWFEIRILLTTVTIAGASICGLACGAYLTTSRGVLPVAGIALALVAAAMVIAGLWIDVDSEGYWKVAASISVFAVACAHLALLSMAHLAESYRWSLIAAYVAIFGVASLIAVLILAEPRGEGMFRLLGIAAIIDAAITILIPIFHWLSKRPASSETTADSAGVGTSGKESLDQEIARLKARLAELEAKKRQRA